MTEATRAPFARSALLAVTLALSMSGAGAAQTLGAERPRGAGRLLIEWSGGSVGSAAGFGVGFLIAERAECATEDLECTLRKAGVALLSSALGAGAGGWGTGRLSATEPSLLGSLLGGVAGIPAGIGVVHLASEDLDWTRNDVALFVSYTITQGLVAALGSRLAAWIRD